MEFLIGIVFGFILGVVVIRLINRKTPIKKETTQEFENNSDDWLSGDADWWKRK